MPDELVFKELLQFLHWSFGSDTFGTYTVYGQLTRRLLIPESDIISKKSLKWVSNSLDILYRMRFLARTRVKRQVRTKSGVKCNRGYAYVYRVSAQGLSYLEHLRNPEASLRRRGVRKGSKFARMLAVEFARNRLLLNEKTFANKIVDFVTPEKPESSIERRFPVHSDPVLVFHLARAYREIGEWKSVSKELLKLAKERTAN